MLNRFTIAMIATAMATLFLFSIDPVSQVYAITDKPIKGAVPVDAKARKVRVYVASPYGFAQSTERFMNVEFYNAIRNAGCEILDPWRHRPPLPPPMKLGEGNARDIEEADGLVAVLDGSDVDSGTAAEIGYASAKGKWIIGYRGDFRKTGESSDVVVNLQVQYFIQKNSGKIVTRKEGASIEDTMKELTELLMQFCKM